MRNELNTFKALFEDIRVLGINKNLPDNQHTQISPNITIWFADNKDVTSIQFGERYYGQLEIMKYSQKDTKYKVSLSIDITDEELHQLINIVIEEYEEMEEEFSKEYKKMKISLLKEELERLEKELV